MFEPISGKPVFDAVSEEGGDAIVSAEISHSSLDSRVAYLTCGMGPVPNRPDTWEFYFQFDVVAIDGDYPAFMTQDRYRASEFIPERMRCEIMDLVLDGLRRLLAKITPDAVYLVTKASDLPDKALIKFRRVQQELENNGFFLLDEDTIELGRRYWLMCKKGN